MGTSVRQSEAENFHVAVMKTEDARIRGNCGCTCRSQHGLCVSVVACTVKKKHNKKMHTLVFFTEVPQSLETTIL